MTLEWLLRALAAGALLGVGALAAERVLGWFRLPRRGAWAAAMAGTVLLPLVALAAPGALPDLRLPRWAGRAVRPAPDAAVPSQARAAVTQEFAGEAAAGPRPLPRGARLGWPLASVAMLGALGWSYARLRTVRGRCTAAVVDGAAVLVADRAGPMVLGITRPAVVLPRWVVDAPPEERALIVRHEVEHVLGGDALLLLLSTLAVAAMPWNPALWWQHRRLRLAVETDCDARVLAAGAGRREYGRVLLRTAERPPFLPVLALAWGERTSHLERRILAMTARQPRHRLVRALPLLVLAAGMAAAACGIASDGRGASATAADLPRTHTLPAVNGRTATVTDYPDGTSVITVPGRPGQGAIGLGYGWDERIVMREGDTGPIEFKTYPVIRHVEEPAMSAGFLPGDLILSSNGRDARMGKLFPDRNPGARYTVRIRRGGQERELALTVGLPKESRAGR